MNVIASIDLPKSVRNRCIIMFVVSLCYFDYAPSVVKGCLSYECVRSFLEMHIKNTEVEKSYNVACSKYRESKFGTLCFKFYLSSQFVQNLDRNKYDWSHILSANPPLYVINMIVVYYRILAVGFESNLSRGLNLVYKNSLILCSF